jgi:hypothetical protein
VSSKKLLKYIWYYIKFKSNVYVLIFLDAMNAVYDYSFQLKEVVQMVVAGLVFIIGRLHYKKLIIISLRV